MRAARLVNMLLMLQARGRVTAPEMAAALEVSVRTVHRDIEALAEAGVPVYAERGARGGFRLLGARRFAMAGLTGREAEAVRWVGVPDVTRALGLERERQAAELKLHDALPEEGRAEALAAARHVLIDIGDAGDDARLVRGLRRAIAERRTVHARLRGARASRDYSPLGLVWSGGEWHLVAREAPGGALSALAFSSLELVRTSAAPEGANLIPPGFDLGVAWRALRSGASPSSAEATPARRRDGGSAPPRG